MVKEDKEEVEEGEAEQQLEEEVQFRTNKDDKLAIEGTRVLRIKINSQSDSVSLKASKK